MTMTLTKGDGSKTTLQVGSINVLCLPKDSPIQLQGFTEVAEGSCFPPGMLQGNGPCRA